MERREKKKVRVRNCGIKRGTHTQLGTRIRSRYRTIIPSLNTASSPSSFTTTARLGVLDEPGDGRVLLAEVVEMRGSESADTVVRHNVGHTIVIV